MTFAAFLEEMNNFILLRKVWRKRYKNYFMFLSNGSKMITEDQFQKFHDMLEQKFVSKKPPKLHSYFPWFFEAKGGDIFVKIFTSKAQKFVFFSSMKNVFTLHKN